MQIPPLSRLAVLNLIYKYWLRSLIIDRIRDDCSYVSFLEFCDVLFNYNNLPDI